MNYEYKKHLEEEIIKMIGRNDFKVILCQKDNVQISMLLERAIYKIKNSINDLKNNKYMESEFNALTARHEVIIDILEYINIVYSDKYIEETGVNTSMLMMANHFNLNKELTLENYKNLLKFCIEFKDDIALNRKMMACIKFKTLNKIKKDM